MQYAYHGGTTLYANLLEDIRLAHELGYDGIELWTPKVLRYLDAGFTSEDLALELAGLDVPMLDVIVGFESTDSERVRHRLEECARLAQTAQRIGCPTIQIVATEEFDDDSWTAQRRVLVDSVRAMAECAHSYGVRLAIEPLAYSPFNKIAQALEVIDAVGSERVGLCLDTWHIWISGESLDEISALDPTLILSAQLSDTNPRSAATWRDLDRTALPGDGILPLAEVIDAIRSTGYAGHWCVEMLSAEHREWRARDLASTLLESLRRFVPPEATPAGA